MITKEGLERIKQGNGLTVESNGIRHYNASEVLINGHSLTEVLEAAEAYKEEQPKVLDADGVEIKPGDKLYRSDKIPSLVGTLAGVVKSVYADSCPNPLEGNKPWIRYEDGGWDLAEILTHQKPETLQDVIDDIYKSDDEYWKCCGIECEECPSKIDNKTPDDYYGAYDCHDAKFDDIKRRLEAIAKRMGGDSE